jgi:hypothetical protein
MGLSHEMDWVYVTIKGQSRPNRKRRLVFDFSDSLLLLTNIYSKYFCVLFEMFGFITLVACIFLSHVC